MSSFVFVILTGEFDFFEIGVFEITEISLTVKDWDLESVSNENKIHAEYDLLNAVIWLLRNSVTITKTDFIKNLVKTVQ